MGQYIKHMSANIEWMLLYHKRSKITYLTDDKGNLMTDKEARAELARLKKLGHKLIPCGDCDGFDPFGGGCPGHPVEENTEEGSTKKEAQ